MSRKKCHFRNYLRRLATRTINFVAIACANYVRESACSGCSAIRIFSRAHNEDEFGSEINGLRLFATVLRQSVAQTFRKAALP